MANRTVRYRTATGTWETRKLLRRTDAGTWVWDGTPPPPPSGLSDNFNRADASTLGANWTTTAAGAFGITANQVAALTTFGQVARYTTEPTGSTIWAEIRYVAPATGGTVFNGPAVNVPPLGASTSATDAFYWLSIGSTNLNSLTIRRKANAGATTSVALAATTFTVVPNDVLRLESTPTTLIGYVNGIERIRVEKSAGAALPTVSNGVGFYATGSTDSRFDDFAASAGAASTPAPGTPVLASPATSINAGGFTNSWSAATNATDYLVQRRTGANAFATVATVTDLTHTHSGLTSSTTYDVRIIARNSTVEGTPSNVVSTQTSAAIVPPPSTTNLIVGLTLAELQAIPTSGTGWNNILTQSGASGTALAVDMNSQSSMTAGAAVCTALRYLRTNDEAYRTKVLNGCEAVRTWSGLTHRTAYFRQMAGWAIAGSLIGHNTTAWLDFLDTIRFRNTWNTSHSRWNQMYLTGWDSANNHGTLAAASFLACSIAINDTARINEAIGWVKAYNGDFSSHVTWPTERAPQAGGFNAYQYANTTSWSIAGGTPAMTWVPLTPLSAIPSKEGAWGMDIGRSGNDNIAYSVDVNGIPIWGPSGQDYTEASACGFITSAILLKANDLLPDVFQRGDQGFKRWRDYLLRYTGQGSNTAHPNYVFSASRWIDPVLKKVYGGTQYTATDAVSWSMNGTGWLGGSAGWLN